MSTKLPADLFGDAVMLLEFLHTFGPLFNIREVIQTAITFGEIPQALYVYISVTFHTSIANRESGVCTHVKGF